MSILSSPTVSPTDLFTLASLVRASGGRLPEKSAIAWMTTTGQDAAASKKDERAGDVIHLAKQLGLVAVADGTIRANGTLPATRRELASVLHRLLRESEPENPDSLLLRAYAWFVVTVERHGRASVTNQTADTIADGIESALNPGRSKDDPRQFHKTKLPPWRRWMSFLGLGWDNMHGLSGFLPDPTSRLAEELPSLLENAGGLSANEFLARTGKAMPYLDGGATFESVRKAVGLPPLSAVSSVLSASLRALHGDGIIELSVTGDQAGVRALSPDSFSKVQGFSQVKMARP